eukprot:2426_1
MERAYLLFVVISAIKSVKSESVGTKFKYDYTAEVCSVQECPDLPVMDTCTELVAITDPLAQQYISNTNGECMGLISCDVSQWVWPRSYYNDASSTDSSCHCPRCSCATLGTIEYVKEVDESSAGCWACECEDQSTSLFGDGSATLRGYRCTRVKYSVYLLDVEASIAAFPCPPPICGTFDGEIRYEGDTWWDSSNEESYCLCQSDATVVCSQSYDEILSTPALKEEFDDECELDLRGACRTDASLWFQVNGYPDRCPVCACDTSNEGDLAYFTELDTFLTTGKDCFECTCKAYTDSANADRKGYDCAYDAVYKLSDEELETRSWTCPPVTCDYNDEIKYEDEFWWDDFENDETCQTYCVCQSDATVACSTTYADIVANDALLEGFNDECTFSLFGDCVSSDADVTGWYRDPTFYCGCPESSSIECDPDSGFVQRVYYINIFYFVMLCYFCLV